MLGIHQQRQQELIQYPFSFPKKHWNRDGGTIGACVSPSDPTRGYIGFYQPLNEANGKQLLASAVQWLQEQGVQKIYGPIDYSTWFDYRFLISTTGGPEFSFEPGRSSLDYAKQWTDFGFTLCEEYHSRAYDGIHTALPKTQSSFEKFYQLGYRTRSMDMAMHRDREILAITQINQLSFDRAFLSEPLDAEAYRKLYVPRFEGLLSDSNGNENDSLSFFILDPTGKEIGYFFLFQDAGDQDKPYLIWKTLAIMQLHQGQGLATFGIHHALQIAKKRNLDSMVAALIRKGAPSEILLNKIYDLKWEHRYGVFEYHLNKGSLSER
jgi:GNAT superfamily N-acetyltransferase